MKNASDIPLVNLSFEKLIKYRGALEASAKDKGDIYICSDTETSGTEIVESSSGLFNRVLEWSMVFAYKDELGLLKPILCEDGEMVVMDEPVNPFIEKAVTKKQEKSIDSLSAENVRIHGINIDYLFGKSEGLKSRPILPVKAAPFNAVHYAFVMLLDFEDYRCGDVMAHLVFHNAPFDIKFLNHESEMCNLDKVESLATVIDTLDYAKRFFSPQEVKNNSLDSIFEYGVAKFPEHIEKTDRPIHTALIDSLILLQAYNTIVLHKKQKESIRIY